VKAEAQDTRNAKLSTKKPSATNNKTGVIVLCDMLLMLLLGVCYREAFRDGDEDSRGVREK